MLYLVPEAQQLLLLLLLLEHMREAQHLLLPVLGLARLHMPGYAHCSGLQLRLELALKHCPYRCWAPQQAMTEDLVQGHMLASWVSQEAPTQLLVQGRMSAGSCVLQ